MIRRMRAGSEEFEEYLRLSYAGLEEAEAAVAEIGRLVKERGDAALCELTERFDGARLTPETLRVSDGEIEEAYGAVDDDFMESLLIAIDNVTAFHQKQVQHSWMEPDEVGNILGQLCRPLQRVGIYVPGGTAAYPSSVLMNAIPAVVAGVTDIAMVTPPDRQGKVNPHTLVAASEVGLDEIYKVGGAQAVFALAWGTGSIAPVEKITGPGNLYVTLAKKMVYGQVDIDMLAGPSEILVIADSSANPAYLAADLMSQAEHDVLARCILVTDSPELFDRVEGELRQQMATLGRAAIIERALRDYGAFILVRDMEEACRVANRVAPEHLEVMARDPFRWLGCIRNAGAIFLGEYTPEPVGDYFAGPNHILPTGGTARFYSPVTVDTFTKKSSVLYYSREGLAEASEHIVRLAEVEGLTAHANAIRARKGDGTL
ncbi:MAG: histidinol dehydrogenase [Syntrophomonadaceae bacterium]|nr:histidinol dehydrogenase [Syntrophomonadaceae bacterium]